MLLCDVVSFTRQICHIMSYRYDTTKIDTLAQNGFRHGFRPINFFDNVHYR